MKRWAVGYIAWHNNDLVIEIVSANDWQHAIKAHSKCDEYNWPDSSSLEYVKSHFFNCDSMIDVVQIPTDPELLKLKDLQSRDRWPDTTGGQNL